MNTTKDNQQIRQEFRQIINDLRTFDNANQCEQYIRQMTQERIVLIVSGSLGQQIKGVFVIRSELVAQISRDQISRAKIDNELSISVLTQDAQAIKAHNAMFMWFQLFIEVLVHMNHRSTDRNEIVDIYKNNYKDNSQEMSIIDDFEKNYTAERAIW
ncbi:unnamed protein product [Rotaria sordida]|uniref:Uncharacterized protein n=1 Tax=Rotaria sordida TaxID=392033 RepID=A0A815HSD6_9BILA|nr:unnamed protein product [Rotaria sordida]CAF3920249.1 unnamed protein product [Rotaria sordida]